MKLDFKKPLLSLQGEPALNAKGEPDESTYLNKILADQLAHSQTKTDAVKFWGWALKLTAGEEITLDKSDFDKLKQFISNNDNLFVIAKAQLLDVMGDFKE